MVCDEGLRLAESLMNGTPVPISAVNSPPIVSFRDEKDPRTVEVVPICDRNSKPDDDLRFFVQATRERMTTGRIFEHLPWLRQKMDLLVGYRREFTPAERAGIRTSEMIGAVSFLARKHW